MKKIKICLLLILSIFTICIFDNQVYADNKTICEYKGTHSNAARDTYLTVVFTLSKNNDDNITLENTDFSYSFGDALFTEFWYHLQNNHVTASDFKVINGEINCPSKLYLDKTFVGVRINVHISFDENKLGFDQITPMVLTSVNGNKVDNEFNDGIVDWGDKAEVNCDGIIGQEMLDFLNKIFRWIQIIAPIFVIIMGGIEFAGAILQDDKDALKKASSKFIKRLIIAVALFFIPLIMSWLLQIFNEVTGGSTSICGIGE